MTNTITHDVDETLSQISLIEEAGADLVRISVPDSESSKALSKIIPKRAQSHTFYSFWFTVVP